MKTVDVPQANNLSTVRRVVQAVARGAEDAFGIAEYTGYSLRHTRYRLHAARVLQLLSLSKEDVLAVTALGDRLLQTDAESSREREIFALSIESSPAMRDLAPELLAPKAPSVEALAEHLYHRARLGRSTALRRASGLLTWRRRVLNESMPVAAPPPPVRAGEQLTLF
ncbi:MAG: hypothetical protein ACE366_31000 [Bradymonadia bacterium]